MKLLFDQNISYRISKILSESFPEAKHVSEVSLLDSTDMEIWNYAKNSKYMIVTFDSDYYDFSIVKGAPPKIIWLRMGNATTMRIASTLLANHELIEQFVLDSNHAEIACLEIDYYVA